MASDAGGVFSRRRRDSSSAFLLYIIYFLCSQPVSEFAFIFSATATSSLPVTRTSPPLLEEVLFEPNEPTCFSGTYQNLDSSNLSSLRDTYSLQRWLRLGFPSAPYSISASHGHLVSIKMKLSVRNPHPLQATLPSLKLVDRALSGIDEIRSSNAKPDSSSNYCTGVYDHSEETRTSPSPTRDTLCLSVVDIYSGENGVRDTCLPPRAIAPRPALTQMIGLEQSWTSKGPSSKSSKPAHTSWPRCKCRPVREAVQTYIQGPLTGSHLMVKPSPTPQATTTSLLAVVMFFTLQQEMVSTISGESFASAPRLFFVTLRQLSNADTTMIYVTSSQSCPAETLQGSDHSLSFGLFAESSIVMFSIKATTPPKIWFRFDIVLFNCRSVSMIYCARVWTRQICSLLCHCCASITLRRLKHQRFFTESAFRSPTYFLVAGTTVQEYGLTRFTRYYVTVASPLHYVVSSIDVSSQSRHCDPVTGSVILYGGSQTYCSQNSLVGFLNVDFDFFAFLRTRALGLQVKLLYGSLLSLATSIFRHVLVFFAFISLPSKISAVVTDLAY
ncbi:hypothetical protein YC2023_017645 [Brassica napus]